MARNGKSKKTSNGSRSQVVVHFSRGRAIVPLGRVLDFMSQVWVAQRDTIELYQIAAENAESDDHARRLRQLMRQSEEHLETLETAIRDLGGNPVYLSPEARLQQRRGMDMFRLSAPDDLIVPAHFENLLTAETKNLANWEFLRSITLAIEDPHARDALDAIADRIVDELREHLFWLEQTYGRLMVRRMLRPVRGHRRAA